MTWTNLTFTGSSFLPALKVQQLHDNVIAFAEAHAGAPSITAVSSVVVDAALGSGRIMFGSGSMTTTQNSFDAHIQANPGRGAFMPNAGMVNSVSLFHRTPVDGNLAGGFGWHGSWLGTEDPDNPWFDMSVSSELESPAQKPFNMFVSWRYMV